MDTCPDDDDVPDVHMCNAKIFFKEIDRSTVSQQPGNSVQMVGRFTRGPAAIEVEIVRRGKFYTKRGLPKCLPRSLLFRTRRAAKKFFCNPVLVRSPGQLLALFGATTKRLSLENFPDCGINVIRPPATMHIEESALKEVLENKQGELEQVLGLTPGFFSKDTPNE